MRFEGMHVYGSQRGRLLDVVARGLTEAGCSEIKRSGRGKAPYIVSYVSPSGHREGLICYLMTATKVETRNRPSDEIRFQIKFGSKDSGGDNSLKLYFDPFRVYTTLLLAVDETEDVVVSIDPVSHAGRKMFTNYAYKKSDEAEVVANGLHIWERDVRLRGKGSDDDPELLVGCTVENLYTVIRFERAVRGLDFGIRSMYGRILVQDHEGGGGVTDSSAFHPLELEYGLEYTEILDIITRAPRLLTAVRGQVAERHLHQVLKEHPLLRGLEWLEEDGQPDFRAELHEIGTFTIECKNTSPSIYRGDTFKVDFQRSRSSKTPCSRYYARSDFDVLAACAFPIYGDWVFKYIRTSQLPLRGEIAERSYQDCRDKLYHIVHGHLPFHPTLEAAVLGAGTLGAP